VPAPKGNLNALKHGGAMRRPDRYGLVLPTLGPKMKQIDMKIRQYRQGLESACLRQYGEITIVHASLINAAATCEGMRCLALKTQKEKPDFAAMKAVVQFTEERNRNLMKLKLTSTPAPIDATETWDFAAGDATPSDESVNRVIPETSQDEGEDEAENVKENGLS
jgi:hypothetical protein